MPPEERQLAESVATMTTYKRADGELIMGDYAFMTEPDCFENDDSDEDYYEVIEETWSLVSTRVLKYGRLEGWCHTCEADMTLTEPRPWPLTCDDCECSSTQGPALTDGSGAAGTMG